MSVVIIIGWFGFCCRNEFISSGIALSKVSNFRIRMVTRGSVVDLRRGFRVRKFLGCCCSYET